MRELASHFPDRPLPPPQDETPILDERLLGEEATDLRDYWQVIKKRRAFILMFLCAVVLATVFATLTTVPIYTAETTLLIERKAPRAINIDGAAAESQGPDEYDYYRTQYEVLRSRDLIAQVIQEQGLERDNLLTGGEKTKGLVAGLWAWVWNRTGTSPPPDQKTQSDISGVGQRVGSKTGADLLSLLSEPRRGGSPGIDSHLIEAYTGMLAIRPVPHTRLVKIAFSTPDPEASARAANAHAQVFIRRGVELRSRTDEEAQGFLEENLVELRERLEKSEAALNSYRRDKGIISLDDKENIVVSRLADLNRNLTKAEAERIALEAQVALVRKKAYDSLPSVINNSLIQSLKEQLVRHEAEHATLSSQFKSGYPRLAELEAQLARIHGQLQQEIHRVAESIELAYQFAVSKERDLRDKMEEQKAATLRLKDASVGYAILAREVDTNRQLYDNVLQRMKEVGVAAELRDSNVSVIDEAVPPLRPSKPRKLLSLLLSLVGGLMGGVSLAFFLEHLDNTLKTPEEVERYLNLPNLGVVPDLLRLPRRGNGLAREPVLREAERVTRPILLQGRNGNSKPRTAGIELVLSHHPLSMVTEAYRTLRMMIVRSRAEEPPKTILFTSAVAGEGKTATTVNTAIIFARLSLRVLVIDADLRRSRCHELLGMENGVGLTEFLTSHREVRQVIKHTAVENLFFLSSGKTPPNPAELLGSGKMQEMLQVLLQDYDCIFIDSPPMLPVSDSAWLSTMVDGVVLVVDGRATPRKAVKQAQARLRYARAKILGVVLNRVDMQRGEHGYYGYYGSPYHYADTEGGIGDGRGAA